MAKKVSRPVEKKKMEMRGMRTCAKCGGLTKGARSLKCSQCGEEFPVKTKGAKGKGKGNAKPLDAIKNTVKQIQALGGLEEVSKLIASAEKLSGLGGLDEAKEAVALLESVVGLFEGDDGA